MPQPKRNSTSMESTVKMPPTAVAISDLQKSQDLHNGWGTFYFRLPHIPRPLRTRQPILHVEWSASSLVDPTKKANVLLGATLESIKLNLKPLPLLKLPQEVRQIIYGYLIEPFREDDGNIHMILDDDWSTKTHQDDHSHIIVANTDLVEFPGSNAFGRKTHATADHDDFMAIWSLSSSCHQVREELGALFWKNVLLNCVECDIIYWDGDALARLALFMQQRPKAAKALKSLIWRLIVAIDLQNTQRRLREMAHVMKEQLTLDTMVLNIYFMGPRSPILKPDTPWIQTFRGIRKKNLVVNYDCGYGLTTSAHCNLSTLLEDTVLPETELTAEDEYLRARKE